MKINNKQAIKKAAIIAAVMMLWFSNETVYAFNSSLHNSKLLGSCHHCHFENQIILVKLDSFTSVLINQLCQSFARNTNFTGPSFYRCGTHKAITPMISSAVMKQTQKLKELDSTSRELCPQPPFTNGVFMDIPLDYGLSYQRKMLAVFSPVVIELLLQYRTEFFDFQKHQGKLMHVQAFAVIRHQQIKKQIDSQIVQALKVFRIDHLKTHRMVDCADVFRRHDFAQAFGYFRNYSFDFIVSHSELFSDVTENLVCEVTGVFIQDLDVFRRVLLCVLRHDNVSFIVPTRMDVKKASCGSFALRLKETACPKAPPQKARKSIRIFLYCCHTTGISCYYTPKITKSQRKKKKVFTDNLKGACHV